MVGGIVSAIGNAGAEGRQLKQQQKLMDQQIQGSKELSDYSKENQMDIWNRTNYEAQMEHLKKAGLNPGLLYGKGGQGGTLGGGAVPMPTGGQAASVDPNAKAGKIMEASMMLANKALIDSQTKKNIAEANAISGVKTAEGQQNIEESKTRTASQNFDLEMKKTLQPITINNAQIQNDIQALERSRTNANWETYLSTGYEGKEFNDPNTPIAKALKAGWERTLTDLEGAKASNDLTRAKVIVEQFGAELAKQGIAPSSPWYVKFMSDLLGEMGINAKDTLNFKK